MNVSWPVNLRASLYAERDGEANLHSLHGANQVRGGLSCFAIPNRNK